MTKQGFSGQLYDKFFFYGHFLPGIETENVFSKPLSRKPDPTEHPKNMNV